MICVHGMFDSRLSFKQICEKEDVLSKRDCYLVGTRNHAFSDHHDDMYYTSMADDIIRFADQQGLETFTLMGHSMGGKIVMTAACKYPERVNGVIALDAAPWNWNRFWSQKINRPFKYLRMMKRMSGRNMNRKEAMAYIKKKYGKRNPANAAMFMKLIDRKFNDKLVWTLNVDAVLNGNISGFDTKLRYDKPTAYFLRGAKSFDFFRSIVYRKVFPKMDKKNII